ncbi:putative transcription factor ARF family [Lupinus albus]|uniref:Auxin response factor n=1 Tax=Lupinus albus TaxID=3870 RepID=A0A6A4PWN7_LUPAL|nr:putative transcription factor ARF family [Lupinus albus]
MSQSSPFPSHVDPKIWRTCAGAAVKIPNLHSRVYYFPQGHLEHVSPSPSPHYSSLPSFPVVHCLLSNVQFLADPLSDQVFAKLLLQPIPNRFVTDSRNEVAGEGGDGDNFVSYAKILTPSDANNGGGFSVPRFCADSVLPPLDFEADPPVQILNVTDVHGKVWQFRHIYRGTPRRHLLTSGWSKFVTQKNLVAGDSVVFMKNSKGEVFVGIRRALWFSGTTMNRAEYEEDGEGYSGGCWRRGTGRLSVKVVLQAAEAASQGMPFEIVYYPRAGWSDFVVNAEVVEEAMGRAWGLGMRVKMAMETEDSSRMTWFQGTVTSASVPDSEPWRGSPWRMLQVAWDEPEVLQNAKRVSPWQVELVSPPSLHTAFPPTKKFRAAQGLGVLSDREGGSYFPMAWFTSSSMGHLNKTLLRSESFPVGMQGASSSFGNNTMPMLKTVSTELIIGSPQSEDLSPNSQSSLPSSGMDFAGGHNCNAAKVGSGSFLLFGKIIQPVGSDICDAGCVGDHGSKVCADGETEGVDNPPEHSSTYLNLLNRHDVQSHSNPPVEVCYM